MAETCYLINVIEHSIQRTLLLSTASGGCDSCTSTSCRNLLNRSHLSICVTSVSALILLLAKPALIHIQTSVYFTVAAHCVHADRPRLAALHSFPLRAKPSLHTSLPGMSP